MLKQIGCSDGSKEIRIKWMKHYKVRISRSESNFLDHKNEEKFVCRKKYVQNKDLKKCFIKKSERKKKGKYLNFEISEL